MCMTWPNVCNGQHQNMFGHHETHIGQENGQSKGKKRVDNSFVLPPIRTP
jgi:hypothetical protein